MKGRKGKEVKRKRKGGGGREGHGKEVKSGDKERKETKGRRRKFSSFKFSCILKKILNFTSFMVLWQAADILPS